MATSTTNTNTLWSVSLGCVSKRSASPDNLVHLIGITAGGMQVCHVRLVFVMDRWIGISGTRG